MPRCGRRHMQLARTKCMSPGWKVLPISPKKSKKFGKLLMEREEEIETAYYPPSGLALAPFLASARNSHFPCRYRCSRYPHPHPCFCPCRQPPSSCPVAEQHHHLATSVCVFSLPCSIAPHPSAGGCAFVLVPTTVTTPPCLQYGSSISMIEIRPKCIIMHPLLSLT